MNKKVNITKVNKVNSKGLKEFFDIIGVSEKELNDVYKKHMAKKNGKK